MKCFFVCLFGFSLFANSLFAGEVTSTMISYKKSMVGSFLVFQVLDQTDNLIADSTFTDEDFDKTKYATVFCLRGKGKDVADFVRATGAKVEAAQSGDSFLIKTSAFTQVQKIFNHPGVILVKPTRMIAN